MVNFKEDEAVKHIKPFLCTFNGTGNQVIFIHRQNSG